ncbi:hypothetical protein ACFYO7_32315 [Nocardia salmonicida]|uniref:hypothetical protein n=1 Tax=Nocardia salmonicida TaxID=53431 RepID=UPI003682D05C
MTTTTMDTDDLAREVAAAWVSNPNLGELATAERAIWSRVTGWTGTTPSPGPPPTSPHTRAKSMTTSSR